MKTVTEKKKHFVAKVVVVIHMKHSKSAESKYQDPLNSKCPNSENKMLKSSRE